jgi:hypothetical protein
MCMVMYILNLQLFSILVAGSSSILRFWGMREFKGSCPRGTKMIGFLAMVVTIASTLELAHGQPGIGSRYGSRDPSVCKSQKEPATGAPSPSQIADYLKMQE